LPGKRPNNRQQLHFNGVAYIDVKVNANANELARRAADQFARGFICGKDELKVVGAPGRAVELAKRD
jgi:hypothetical protein